MNRKELIVSGAAFAAMGGCATVPNGAGKTAISNFKDNYGTNDK